MLACCMMLYRLIYWFFFFQAEDGIRDGRVTGVQTCALPIFPPRNRAVAVARQVHGELEFVPRADNGTERAVPETWERAVHPRSEERRVGKEGRSRWWQ